MLIDTLVGIQKGGGDSSLLGANEPSSPYNNGSLLGKLVSTGVSIYEAVTNENANPNDILGQASTANKSTPQPVPAKTATASTSTYIYLILAAVVLFLLMGRR
jgi:hypothetical protein